MLKPLNAHLAFASEDLSIFISYGIT